MVSAPFKIEVYLERTDSGHAFEYNIFLNGMPLITGERASGAGVRWAARAQLEQLKRDIQKALDSL